MESGAWRQLLDELNLYIEANYADVCLAPASVENPILCEARRLTSFYEDEEYCDISEDFLEERRCERRSRVKAKATKEPDINCFLEDFEKTETFSEALLRIIKEKDLIEAEVYHRVFMDRKLFSKIRNDRTYQPSKRTAILLSVALRLTVAETQEFLGKAGFALTHTSKTDIIIEFFMLRGNYDVFEINAALYEHCEPPLN